MGKKYYEHLHLAVETLSEYASEDARLSTYDLSRFTNDLHGTIDRLKVFEDMAKETINNLKSYTLGLGEGVDNFQPLYKLDEQYRKLVDDFEEQYKNE